MRALGKLGLVEIPDEISSIVAQGRADWRSSGRRVWEQHRCRPYQSGNERTYLDERTADFISHTLEAFGIDEYDEYGHSLLLFGDVSRHDDEIQDCNGRPAAFFHLILSGSGTLRLPGLRDKQLRNLKMTEGLAFWFNPRIAHLVKNASNDGLASLTATICLPRCPA